MVSLSPKGLDGKQGRGVSEYQGRVDIRYNPRFHAPVAQLDRVGGFEPLGREFESLRARQSSTINPHTARRPLMRIVEITREPVELYKIRKFEGLVTTGGEAKLLIGDGQVNVNGVIETRRRRKIVHGDVIDFRGEQLQVQLV